MQGVEIKSDRLWHATGEISTLVQYRAFAELQKNLVSTKFSFHLMLRRCGQYSNSQIAVVCQYGQTQTAEQVAKSNTGRYLSVLARIRCIIMYSQ